MKKRLKMLITATTLAFSISFLHVQLSAQEEPPLPPVYCNGVPEPNTRPLKCGRRLQPDCQPKDCNGVLGNKVWNACCKEVQGTCVAVKGRWCCPSGTWNDAKCEWNDPDQVCNIENYCIG